MRKLTLFTEHHWSWTLAIGLLGTATLCGCGAGTAVSGSTGTPSSFTSSGSGASGAGTSAAGTSGTDTSGSIAATLPHGMVASINGTNVVLSTNLSSQAVASASVSQAAAAVSAQAETPGLVSAAQLVDLTSFEYPGGRLVWAVDVIPAGGYTPRLNGPTSGASGLSSGTSNFQVDFVDAKSGRWLFDVEAYDPQLPPANS